MACTESMGPAVTLPLGTTGRGSVPLGRTSVGGATGSALRWPTPAGSVTPGMGLTRSVGLRRVGVTGARFWAWAAETARPVSSKAKERQRSI